MISARGRERTRRLLVTGLLLSVLIHLGGGMLWSWLAHVLPKPPQMASLRAPRAAKVDRITIERAAPTPQARLPRAALRHPRLAPEPPPARPPLPPVAAARAAVVHVVVHAPRQIAGRQDVGVVEAPPAIERPLPPAKPAFNAQQLARMKAQFAQTIAAVHEDAGSVTAQAARRPIQTIKRYAMPVFGIHEGLNPGDGIISYLRRERHGDQMWYWTHYVYMYGDGHIEESDIPWVFKYPIGDDPFARGDHRIPIQPPPPGYVPDHPLEPLLEQFFGGPRVD